MADNGVTTRAYPKSMGGSKQTSMSHPSLVDPGGMHGQNTGPTGSPREYPKGKSVDTSANFNENPTDLYVGGVGPGV